MLFDQTQTKRKREREREKNLTPPLLPAIFCMCVCAYIDIWRTNRDTDDDFTVKKKREKLMINIYLFFTSGTCNQY